jgi:hypothetical protein
MRVGSCPKCNEAIIQFPCKCHRNKFKVITLCGSTKFQTEFENVNEKLTMAGNVVISVGVFGHSKGIKLSDKEKFELDLIHLRKIDLADEIFVINVDGYIGSSTKREIEYAELKGKKIHYLEVI